MIVQNDDFGGSRSRLRKRIDEFLKDAGSDVVFYECKTADEVKRVKYFRFAAAPAFQTFCAGSGLQGISFDFALPKNYDGTVTLQPPNSPALQLKMMYGHFGCGVYHYDVAVAGTDADAAIVKENMIQLVQGLGGKLPAEHGHGTEYAAPPETLARWEKTDPRNLFNPGVGKANSSPMWKQ